MSLKIFTINIEGNRHFARWPQVVNQEKPDVLCLQEVYEVDVPFIEEATGLQGEFFAMMNIAEENKYKLPPRGRWGVGYFTNLPTTGIPAHYYSKTAQVQDFTAPNDASRVFVVKTVEKDGVSYTVGTTHFTWSGGGEATDDQRADQRVFLEVLQQFPDIVFCGDFNAPRGGEIFAEFEKYFIDHLPKDVTTTIDSELHYAAPLELVVDTIFSTPHYKLSNVRAISGVSDHIGVVGEVERVETEQTSN